MTFNGFPYTRPDLADLKAQLDRILQSLQQAGDAPAFLEILHEYDSLKSHFMTLAELAAIRHTLDTRDPFYTAENDWFDASMPLIE